MKARVAKAWGGLAAAVIGGGLILGIYQRREMASARGQQRALAGAAEEAATLTLENGALTGLRVTNEEVRQLRAGAEKLARLRGEVETLRAQVIEVRRVRAENERMTALAQGQTNELPANYLKRADMADVGTATPEAAVETVLYAMTQGDVQRVAECTGGPRNIPQDELARQQQQMAESFSNFAGFYISNRKELSPDAQEVDVRAVAGGAELPLHLMRNGGEWVVGESQ